MSNGDKLYYAGLAAKARQEYNETYAAGYRASDDRGLHLITHTEYMDMVTAISTRFRHAINVLDIGCGTGRYFHCVRNVKSLTGIDISSDMLAQAKHPVCGETLTVVPQLICQSLTDMAFPDASFDFIYSIGVLGEFMPFDDYMAHKIHRMLTPNGQVLLTVVASDSRHTIRTWKRRMLMVIAPMLPGILKRRLMIRLRELALSESDLKRLFAAYSSVSIRPRVSATSSRKHWVVTATR